MPFETQADPFGSELLPFAKKAPFGFLPIIAARSCLRVLPDIARPNFVDSQKMLNLLRAALTLHLVSLAPDRSLRTAIDGSVLHLEGLFSLGPERDLFIACDLLRANADSPSKLIRVISGKKFLRDERLGAVIHDRDFLAKFRSESIEEARLAISTEPLWPVIPNEISLLLDRLWQVGVSQVDDQAWSFWRDWYEKVLLGRPRSIALDREIALMPNKDWILGPTHTAGKINECIERFWAQALPQHEVITQDQNTGRFSVSYEAVDQKDAVEQWLRQVEFATQLAVESNTSEFSRMCTAYKYIQHTLENCRHDANAIEQQFGIAKSIVEENLARSDYEADDSLLALHKVLANVQIQMRADHPQVREAWERRIQQKLRETDSATSLHAAQAILAELERTDGRLNEEMRLDADTLTNSTSVEAKGTALRRAGGRAAKMNLIERSSKAVHRVDGSTGYKAVRIGSTGYTVGDILWMLKDLLGF